MSFDAGDKVIVSRKFLGRERNGIVVGVPKNSLTYIVYILDNEGCGHDGATPEITLDSVDTRFMKKRKMRGGVNGEYYIYLAKKPYVGSLLYITESNLRICIDNKFVKKFLDCKEGK